MQLVLWCAVLVHSSFVAATPHGYGVRGGAAAKADAIAAAGAYSGYGGVPVGIPAGAGFSGSFTKSSSASSASSSASASSSSFSFSGSGYPGASGGCRTGNCENSGSNNGYTNGQNSGTLNGSHNPSGYKNAYPIITGANAGAAAAAQAGAVAGSQLHYGANSPPCAGNNCPQKGGDCKESDCDAFANGNKCTSGNCQPSPAAQPSSVDYPAYDNKGKKPIDVNANVDTTKKCESGECGTPAFATLPGPDSSFPKCTTGQCAPSPTFGPAAYGPNITPNIDGPSKETTHSDSNSNKCTSGQCAPSTSDKKPFASPEDEDIPANVAENANSKSDIYNQNNHQSNDNDKAYGNSKHANCAYGHCGSTSPNYQDTKPYLTPTTNIDTSKCNSPNCKNDIHNYGAAAAGSAATAAGSAAAAAYNKPATYLTTPKQEPSCTSPNCKTPGFIPGQNPSSYVVPVTGSHPNIPNISTNVNCVGGNCANNQPNSYYSSPNSPAAQNPTSDYGPPGCTSPNCASTSYFPSNQYNPAQPNDISKNKPPTHSQVFPSPESSVSTYTPQSSSPGYYNTPSIIPDKSSVLQPSLTSSSSSSGPSKVPNQFTKPSAPKQPSEEEPYPFLPLSSSGSPPCGGNDCSGVQTTKPNYGPNSAQSSFIHLGPIATPTFSTYPSAVSNTGPSNTNKPLQNSKDKPAYTGGFGGPQGFLKPNDFSIPSTAPIPNKPAAEGQNLTPCSTGSCNSPASPRPIDVANINGTPTKPNNGSFNGIPTGPHNVAPCTTGNCGSPSGNSGSNVNLNGIATGPNNGNFNGISSGPHNEAPCTTGKCGPPTESSGSNVNLDGFPTRPNNGNFNGISSGPHNEAPCTTGKCGPPTGSSGSNVNLDGFPTRPNSGNINGIPSGPHNVAPCTTGKCGPPTGSSGSNVNLDGIPTRPNNENFNGIPSGPHNVAPCTTGKCGSPFGNSGSNINSNGIATGSNNGNLNGILSGPHNVAPCTGKCGSPTGSSGPNNVNAVHAAAGAAASANAVAYTGGFGGPPGFLKPFDGLNGKDGHSRFDVKHSQSSQFVTGPIGNPTNGVHSYNNNGAGNVGAAQAFSAAAAGANAGAFSGGSHPGGHFGHHVGSDHKTGGGCAGGCASNGSRSNGSGWNLGYNDGSNAAAKAGAVSGANSGAGSFGYGGSFASSSASAHASAGAAIKGYGRR